MNEGDSLVHPNFYRYSYKKDKSAPFMKKGQFIYQYFKVVKLFSNKEEADAVAKTFEDGCKSHVL